MRRANGSSEAVHRRTWMPKYSARVALIICAFALLFARVTGQTAPVTLSDSEVSINCNSDSTSEVIFQAKASTDYTKNNVLIDTGAVFSDACVQIKTNVPSPEVSVNFTSGTQKVVVFCDKASDDLYDVNATADGYETRQNNLIADINATVGVYGDTVNTGKNLTLAVKEGEFTTLNGNADSLTSSLSDCTGAGEYMAWNAAADDWSCHQS
jgi:hypothetical protein